MEGELVLEPNYELVLVKIYIQRFEQILESGQNIQWLADIFTISFKNLDA